MKFLAQFLKSTITGGLLIIVPIGLLIVLVMKFVGMLRPLTEHAAEYLPETFRFPMLVALALLLILSFAAGLLALTSVGRGAGRFIESAILNRIPGYSIMRSLTHRIGDAEDTAKFAPAFVEIEEALAMAFIIEEHNDGKYTVFVPSAPTPHAGSIYIMDASRVHFIDAPFIKAVRSVSRFGVGSEELLLRCRHPSSKLRVLSADAD